jgi:hypothetical protein
LTTTFRRGSDFRAYVQDSLATQGEADAGKPAGRAGRPALRPSAMFAAWPAGKIAALREAWRARIGAPSEQPQGATPTAALSARVARAAAGASAWARQRPGAMAKPPASDADDLRARRVGARQRQSETPKRTPEQSRREIEAVQARLDAMPAPSDPQGHWTAQLAREYRKEFHPLGPGPKPSDAPPERHTAADGAAAALFHAGKAAWRMGLWLQPGLRFVSAHSAPILKVAAVALAIVGAAGFLAQWPQGGQDETPDLAAAPATPRPARLRPAWQEIQKPFHLFNLPAPELAHERQSYSARRHTTGGGRDDVLTFGEFAGTGAFLRLSVYRHGSEKTSDAAFFVDMARRAAPLGLSLGRANVAQTQSARFGEFETAAMTMTQDRVTRENCRGFRFSATQLGLTIAGFACGAGDEAMSAPALACLLNRLDLVSAGDDQPLRDFFAAAEARGPRGCAEATAPSRKRAGEAKGLQENRAGGVF